MKITPAYVIHTDEHGVEPFVFTNINRACERAKVTSAYLAYLGQTVTVSLVNFHCQHGLVAMDPVRQVEQFRNGASLTYPTSKEG